MAAKLNLSVFNSVEIRDIIDITTAKSHLKPPQSASSRKEHILAVKTANVPGSDLSPAVNMSTSSSLQNSHHFTTGT